VKPPSPSPAKPAWGFCPRCLAIHALDRARCPKCGEDLVPLATGKELYKRLKAEKRERGEL